MSWDVPALLPNLLFRPPGLVQPTALSFKRCRISILLRPKRDSRNTSIRNRWRNSYCGYRRRRIALSFFFSRNILLTGPGFTDARTVVFQLFLFIMRAVGIW